MAEVVEGANLVRQTASQKRMELLNDYLADSKNKSYFVGAITTIFFVVFMIFGVIPSFRAVLSQNSDNAEIQKGVDRVSQKITDMRAMITETETDATVLNKFQDAFPDQFNQDSVSAELYDYADQNSSYIKDINFYTDDRSKTLLAEFGTITQVDYVALEVKFEGPKEGLGRLVQNLENSSRIYNIQTINLSRKSSDDIQLYGLDKEYDLDIIMEYFFYAPEKDANVNPDSEQVIPGFITINR